MKHRPDYIAGHAPYVRAASYVPPPSGRATVAERRELANPISRWAVSWRSVVYLAGVLLALAALIGMFAYGVIVIGRAYPVGRGGNSSTWVTPATYGPPVGTPR